MGLEPTFSTPITVLVFIRHGSRPDEIIYLPERRIRTTNVLTFNTPIGHSILTYNSDKPLYDTNLSSPELWAYHIMFVENGRIELQPRAPKARVLPVYTTLSIIVFIYSISPYLTFIIFSTLLIFSLSLSIQNGFFGSKYILYSVK